MATQHEQTLELRKMAAARQANARTQARLHDAGATLERGAMLECGIKAGVGAKADPIVKEKRPFDPTTKWSAYVANATDAAAGVHA
jgi:hypothetical protein